MVAATSHGSAARPNASSDDSRSSRSTTTSSPGTCAGRCWGHRVDPHAVLDGLDGTAPGQRHHAGLRGGVVDCECCARQPNTLALFTMTPPWPASRSSGPAGTRRAHHRGEADVEHPVPFLVGHVDHRRLPTETGVVDQHVQPAQPRGGRGDQRIDLRGGGQRRRPHSPPGPGPGSPAARASRRGGAHDDRDDDVGSFEQRPARSTHRSPCRRRRSTTTLPVRSPCPSISSNLCRSVIPLLSRQAEHSARRGRCAGSRSIRRRWCRRARTEQPPPLIEVVDSPSRSRPALPSSTSHGELAEVPMPIGPTTS